MSSQLTMSSELPMSSQLTNMPHQQVLTYPPAKRPSDLCNVVFLRYALYGYNIILLMSGLALLAFGIWTLLEKLELSALLPPFYTISVYATCVIGAVVVTACVIGCHGVMQEKRCSMITYTVLLVLILLSEIATGVISYWVYSILTQSSFNQLLYQDGVFLWTGEQDSVSKAIDTMHSKYSCCGADSHEDWQRNAKILSLNTTTPDSCCITVVQRCGKVDHPSNLNTQGCASFVEQEVALSVILIPALNLGFGILQVFGVVLSCAYTRQMTRSKKFVRRRYSY